MHFLARAGEKCATGFAACLQKAKPLFVGKRFKRHCRRWPTTIRFQALRTACERHSATARWPISMSGSTFSRSGQASGAEVLGPATARRLAVCRRYRPPPRRIKATAEVHVVRRGVSQQRSAGGSQHPAGGNRSRRIYRATLPAKRRRTSSPRPFTRRWRKSRRCSPRSMAGPLKRNAHLGRHSDLTREARRCCRSALPDLPRWAHRRQFPDCRERHCRAGHQRRQWPHGDDAALGACGGHRHRESHPDPGGFATLMAPAAALGHRAKHLTTCRC